MRLKDLIIGFMIGLIIGITVFSVIKAFGEEIELLNGASTGLDRVREKDEVYMYEKSMKEGEGLYIYVYDDKTQLWNRAREETLKNAACDKLHTYVVVKGAQ